ncbi:TRAP transporter small permease [Siminovitchia acidinfaciens]|uniref:TRAP transporter small permease n=1 Tax=Siminovitchia acidinfaciens TaxID=2321395 RepID=A0A429Y722_9BACI|nr:TRAP transporter small permease [Siminovitchia acidinfaciens]RST77230.1 TRAP transporter small permease [Siminovitchia acidinfaciens]
MGTEQSIQLDTENPKVTVHKDSADALSNEGKPNIFFKITDSLNRGLAFIAGLSLICMMLLVVFNSIKRLFSDPIAGTVELVSWLGAITAVFSLGYAQLHKGHVFIDLLIVKFPSGLQKLTHSMVNVFSILFFTMAGWQITLYGMGLKESGVVSETMQVAFYPLVILCSIGFFSLVLAIVKETVEVWKGAK